jgi:hypothetical protein
MDQQSVSGAERNPKCQIAELTQYRLLSSMNLRSHRRHALTPGGSEANKEISAGRGRRLRRCFERRNESFEVGWKKVVFFALLRG